MPLSPFPQDRFDKDSTSWLIFAGVWVMGVSGEWEIGGVWSHCAGLWWGRKKQHGAVVCYSSSLWCRRMGGQSWFPWKDPGGFISVVGELLLSHPKQRQWKQASSIPLWTFLSHFTSVLWFSPHSHFSFASKWCGIHIFIILFLSHKERKVWLCSFAMTKSQWRFFPNGF